MGDVGAFCCCRLVIAGVLSAIPAGAYGNGAMAEFSAGGVEFQEAANIAIEREDLFLSSGEVRVRYTYRSVTGEAQNATLGFPMPPVPMEFDRPDYLGGHGPGERDPRNYMNLEVSVEGKTIEPELHEYALLDGRDVSSLLIAYDIPLFLQPQDISRLSGLGPEAMSALTAAGVVHRSKSAPEFVTPLWEYQAIYEWLQDFGPDRTVVEIRYRPLTGSDIEYDVETGRPVADYCIDDAVTAGVARRKSAGQYYELTTLSYILTTARKWAGSIGDFNLTVSKEFSGREPADVLVAFCPADAKKVSPTEFRWSARDFVPERQINVVFFEFLDPGE